MFRFFARRDAGTGTSGNLDLADPQKRPSVELVFETATGIPDFAPHNGTPNEDQMVVVNGVRRYFWVEFSGPLRPRQDLRRVRGQDLRRKDIRVITTDDGSRYAFLADPAFSRDIADAIPPGQLQAMV